MSRSLLTRWRKEVQLGLLGLLGGTPAAFMPLQIASDPTAAGRDERDRPDTAEKIEITLTNRRRLSVASTIDATALSRLLRVLTGHDRVPGRGACVGCGRGDGHAARHEPLPGRVCAACPRGALALQVQQGLGRDPHVGEIFCFRGRKGDLVELLWHDGVGMSLYIKRLEAGKFIWPAGGSGEAVQISAAQLGYLLEGEEG